MLRDRTFQYEKKAFGPFPSRSPHGLRGADGVADKLIADDEVAFGDVDPLLRDVGGNQQIAFTGSKLLQVLHFHSIGHFLLTHQSHGPND